MNRKNYEEKIKQTAKGLRKKGQSYKEIAGQLNVAKSTARLWCNDVVLSKKHKSLLYTKQIEKLSKGPNSSHERRQREIDVIKEQAKQEITTPISYQAYQLFGAALYWAEGNKVKHFAITNSDPLLIKFMVNWLYDILKVTPNNIKAALNIYSGQNETDIINFWSDLTKIPRENFGKSFIKPKSKNYKKNNLYYGTIKIRVSCGTDFRIKIFSWIEAILKEVSPNVDKIETKWNNLKSNYMRC